MRNINAIQAVVFALLISLLGITFAADKPATQADFNELQKQVQSIDKDLAVLKEIKAGLEKRQNEITAQQANSLAAISNQTTTVGNFIAVTTILITLMVFIAGFVTYFSAARKAKEEALAESKKWFDENATELRIQIEKLKNDAEAATNQMDTHAAKVRSDADKATEAIAKSTSDVLAASTSILNSTSSGRGSESRTATDAEALKTVEQASQALKNKPESEFTPEDFYARGLDNYANGNFQSALLAFENAYKSLGEDAPAEPSAAYLFAQGVALGKLGKPEEEIAVYDDIDQRFGQDTAPVVREQVARALSNKGFTLGKLDNPERAIAVYDNIDQRFGKDTVPGVREQVAGALSNKGVALGQLDKLQQEIAVYDDIDQRFGKDTAHGVREKVASALFNKGVVLGHLDKLEQEIAVYDEIDQRFGDDTAPGVREKVASALVNKGVRLGQLDKPKQAIAVYDDIDQRLGKDTAHRVREKVAKALVNKGVRLGQLDEPEQEIAVYEEIDQRFGKDTSPGVREQVARGLIYKGVRLDQLDRPEQAIAVYDDIDQRFGKDTAPEVREKVASALVNKGVRLGKLDRPAQEIAVYDDIVRRFGDDTATSVRQHLATALNSKSFNQILEAKKQWADKQLSNDRLANAHTALQRALLECAQGDRAMILGNLGYTQFLSEKLDVAEASTKECLRLGGQKSFDDQLGDAKLHRVEPQDSDYEKMLTEIWKTVQTGPI